jgi:transcriptional regulator with AAA-type ATPase domain
LPTATITSMPLGRDRDVPAITPVSQLVLSLQADRPTAVPTRFILSDLDEVRFGRGDPLAKRSRRCLTLRVPDPRMSSDHGRLVRDGDVWRLDDPRSKNGCVLNGAPARQASIGDGDLLELGHAFFLFRFAPPAAGPPDLDADHLASPMPELATFAGELAAAFARLALVAETDVPVLITGETGTGKEVVAKALHRMSRRSGAFVPVNCGALPETLVEGELFGSRKGAFSGAVTDRPGLVRGADRGTLFLDEIGELRAESQAALLRVLQEREVMPLGDVKPVKVDVRFCAATHRTLDDMVRAGTFRHDLHARMLGFTIALPELRARREDLGLLVRALLVRTPGGDRARFTPAAVRVLHMYGWPYNVRELERVLARAVAVSVDRPIDVADLGELTSRAAEAAVPERDDDLRVTLIALLEEHRGNIAAVARVFGKDRMQIHRWVRRLAIDLATYRR